jgi:uncharacterized protein (DUF2132 family)
MSEGVSGLPEETGGPMVARAIGVLNEVLLHARRLKVNRSQYLMFLLADMMTWLEVAKATCLKAGTEDWEKKTSDEFMFAAARLFAREAVEKVYTNTLKTLKAGQGETHDLTEKLESLELNKVFEGAMADMDLAAGELVKG